jgi:uncharacterized membrane protein YkoI
MKRALIIFLTALAAALSLTIAATSPSMAQGGSCLEPRDIQNAVSSGDILPLASILSYAGVDQAQEVLSVKVCDRGGQLYYVVAVLDDASNEVQNLTLNAVTGSQ